ncbi:hypothetical protein F5Y15DRAFT_395449 [Xylariaceae sp. FL0016]|nr:hypothetical protein F5Y15DRAFT_395449 [Xylariaceae sp. FL0016]
MPPFGKLVSLPHSSRGQGALHAEIDRPSNSTSVRSISAFGHREEDIGYDGGADIPDIPRKTVGGSRKPTRSIASPARFVTPRTAQKTSVPMDSHTGDYTTSGSHQTRRGSLQDPTGNNPRMVTPEPNDMDEIETRSPSIAPRSILSLSTKSREANSSTSSLAPTHGSSLLGLQTKSGLDNDGLEPLEEEELDPASFDLVAPTQSQNPQYALEARSVLLFSEDHLRVIFEDPLLLQRFTNFLCASRPDSVPLLVYYLNSVKALKALDYANAISGALAPIKGLDFTKETASRTVNSSLQEKIKRAFEALATEELPAYITHTWVQTVSLTIKRRIADTLPANLRDLSEGLAEVFCLTDPSRPDNPIVFASEEFHRTTQYGMGYVLGRNCRFLQGPKTNPSSVRRLREKIAEGKEHCETFLNYRRDGSPFMNLLMVAPLYDSRGTVRYHIGAQVDISGLAKECAGLESLERLVSQKYQDAMDASQAQDRAGGIDVEDHAVKGQGPDAGKDSKQDKDHFRELAERFDLNELRTVRESGGIMHRVHQEDINDTETGANWNKPRLLIRDDAMLDRRDSDPVLQIHHSTISSSSGGRLQGVYEHYLLVRPAPSLKILFASPTLRVPGILQSSFMSRIGGSKHIREAIAQAFEDGNGVTAKVRWISRQGTDGKARWIHATPLLGINGAVGVWMVVLVDDEHEASGRRIRDAPPVEAHIGGRGRMFDGDGELGYGFDGEDDQASLGSFAAANSRALDERELERGSRSVMKGAASHGEVVTGGRQSRMRTPRSSNSLQ